MLTQFYEARLCRLNFTGTRIFADGRSRFDRLKALSHSASRPVGELRSCRSQPKGSWPRGKAEGMN
ncbi:MAG: hypothetical protein ABII06_14860, partial [Pseudomonadota bacterium]